MFPPLGDLAQDRVNSRWLSAFLFCIVITFLYRAVFYAIFLTLDLAPTLPALAPATSLLGQLGAGGVNVGVALTPVTSVQLRAPDTGAPMASESVQLTFSAAAPVVNDYTARFGYGDTLYDYSGIPIGGGFSFPGFVPRLLRTPLFLGTAAATGKDGTARFRRLAPALAVPGAYSASVSVSLRGFSLPDAFPLTVVTTVGDVAISGVNPFAAGAPVLRIGDALPRFTVRITSRAGKGLAGKVAVLLSAAPSRDELSGLAASPDLFMPRLALLRGATSATSDFSGLAVFNNVTLLASSLARVRLVLVADGVVSSGPELHLSVEDEVSLSVVAQPSASVVEGRPLAAQPAVRVTRWDAAAAAYVPARGVMVMAFPAMRSGFLSPNTLAAPALTEELFGVTSGTEEGVLGSLGAAKHTSGFLSLPSDANGLANWTSLGFIRHGAAGAYTLAFFAQGWPGSLQSAVIDVKSSVASVGWWTPTTPTLSYLPALPNALKTPQQLAGEAAAAAARSSSDGTGDTVGAFVGSADAGATPVVESEQPPDATAAADEVAIDNAAATNVGDQPESSTGDPYADLGAFSDDPAAAGGGAGSDDNAASADTATTDDVDGDGSGSDDPYAAGGVGGNGTDPATAGDDDYYGGGRRRLSRAAAAVAGAFASARAPPGAARRGAGHFFRRLVLQRQPARTATALRGRALLDSGAGAPGSNASFVAHICGFPVCNFTACSSEGCPIFADRFFTGASASGFLPGTEQPLPPFPSGVFEGEGAGPVLFVKDALGRPLAGKSALPHLSWRLSDGTEANPSSALPTNSGSYILREFPFTGATTSAMSLPAPLAGGKRGAAAEGLLLLHRAPLRHYATAAAPKAVRDKARFKHQAQTGRPGSFLRLLATPPAALIPPLAQLLLRFAVEGVNTTAKSVSVTNYMDASAGGAGAPFAAVLQSNGGAGLCAALDVTGAPSAIEQTSASEAAAFRAVASPFADRTSFRVRAFNALGQPLAGGGASNNDTWVAMRAVDAAGPFYFAGSASASMPHEDSVIAELTGDFSAALFEYGGMVGGVLGTRVLSAMEDMAVPAMEHASLDGSGAASFPGLRVAAALNTYARFGFSMSYPTLSSTAMLASGSTCAAGESVSTHADYWGAVAACASQYSPAIPITSVVARLNWALNGSEALLPLPNASLIAAANAAAAPGSAAALGALPFTLSLVARDSRGNVLPPASTLGRLLVALDESLQTYPAYLGATARALEPSTLPVDTLTLCEGDDPLPRSNSPQTPNDGDRLMGSAFSPGGSLFASFGLTLQQLKPGVGWEAGNFITTTASGALPALAARSGSPGALSFVGYSLGTLTPSFPPIAFVDNINTVLTLPYTGGMSCPSAAPATTLKLPGACATVADCSGRGSCVCGVCVCPAGYTGAADCSEVLIGAADGPLDTAYASDATLGPLFNGGLPVIDGRAQMEALQRVNNDAMELFPRFLLGTAQVGVVSPRSSGNSSSAAAAASLSALLAKLVSSATQSKAKPKQARSGIAGSVRAGDTANIALASGLAAGSPGSPICVASMDSCFSPPADPSATYRVFPALVDCARGEEVPGAYFMAAPSDTCITSSDQRVLPGSRLATGPPGSSDFAWATGSASLVLLGAPTGCFRVRFVYAPLGSGARGARGSLSDRQVFGLMDAAKAVSLGASRPFRYLSPVVSMSAGGDALPPVLYTGLGGALLAPPTVTLVVRDKPGRGAGAAATLLKDTCSNIDDDSKLKVINDRCPATPKDGLLVFASAVGADGVEYSLFRDGNTFDCARASATFDASTGEYTYKATFPSLVFSPVADLPTSGPMGGLSASGIGPGTYTLKFWSYGVSTLSPYKVTVVAAPQWLAVPKLDASAADGGFTLANAPVGTAAPVTPPISVKALVQSMDAAYVSTYYKTYNTTLAADAAAQFSLDSAAFAAVDGDAADLLASDPLALPEPVYEDGSPIYMDLSRPVPGASLRVSLVAGPPQANAALAPTGLAALTDATGGASFSGVRFTAGVSGTYGLLVTASGYDAAVPVLVNVSNAINATQVSTADGQGPPATSPTAPLKFVKNQRAGVAWRVCLRPAAAGAVPLANETITMRTYLETENSAPAKRAGAPTKPPPPLSLGSALSPTPSPSRSPKPKAPRKQPPKGGAAWPVANLQVADPAAVSLDVLDFFVRAPLTDARAFVALGAIIDSPQAVGAASTRRGNVDVKLKTGADGCADVRALTFSRFGRSTRFRIVFTARGIDSDPINAVALTLQDANPMSPADLRSRIVIPLALTLPAFAANAQWLGPRARLLLSLLAAGGLYVLWTQGGYLFWDDIGAIAVAYQAQNVTMVQVLNALYSGAYALGALAAASLMVSLAAQAVAQLSAGRGTSKKKLSTGSVLSSSALVHAPRFYDAASARGFFGARMRASMQYVRSGLRGAVEPLLLVGEGGGDGASAESGVSPLLVEAVAEVYERFAALQGEHDDVGVALAARDAGAQVAKRGLCSAKEKAPEALGKDGAAALCAFLVDLHLGPATRRGGSGAALSPADACALLQKPPAADDFVAWCSYRVVCGGAGAALAELQGLASDAGAAPLRLRLGRGAVCRAPPPPGAPEGGGPLALLWEGSAELAPPALHLQRYARERLLACTAASAVAHGGCPQRLSPEGRAVCKELRGALADASWGALLEAVAPGVREVLAALNAARKGKGEGFSAPHLQAFYHARLSTPRPPAAPPRLRVLVRDGPVWAELRALGYDSLLQLRPLSAVGALAPHARAALALLFADTRALCARGEERKTLTKKKLGQAVVDALAGGGGGEARAVVPTPRDGAPGARIASEAQGLAGVVHCVALPRNATAITLDEANEQLRWLRHPVLSPAHWHEAVVAQEGGEVEWRGARLGVDGLAAYALSRYEWAPDGGAPADAEESAEGFLGRLLVERGYGPTGRHLGSAKDAKAAFAEARFALRTAKKSGPVGAYAAFLKPLAAAAAAAPPTPIKKKEAATPAALAAAALRGRGKGVLRVSALDGASKAAFFFPQRMLVALVLAFLGVAFSALLSVQSALGAVDTVGSLFDSFDAATGTVLSTMADGLTASTDRVNAAVKAASLFAQASAGASAALPTAASSIADSLVSSARARGSNVATKLALASKAAGAADPSVAAFGAGSSAVVLGVLGAADAEGGGADGETSAADSAAAAAAAQMAQLMEASVASAVAYASALVPDPTAQLAVAAPPKLVASLNASTAVLSKMGLTPGTMTALAGVLADLAGGRVAPRAAARTLLAAVLGGDVSELTAAVREWVLVRMWACIGVSLGLSFAYVAGSLWLVAKGYRAAALAARRGGYPGGSAWKWKRSQPKTWKLIGLQLGLALAVYYLVYFLLLVVTGALSTFVAEAAFWRTLWAIAWPIILAVLSVALAQSLAQTLFINHVLLDGRNIAVPRVYAFADLWFTFMGLIAGAIQAVARVVGGLVAALLSLMRIDRSIADSRDLDMGASTFDATLAIDIQQNHPALLAAVDCLQRCAEAAAARKLRAPGSPGASPRPLNRWLLALTLARNPALRAHRRVDATSDGALLAAPGLLEQLGLTRAEKVEGPSGPAYGLWLEDRSREAAKHGSGGGAPRKAAPAVALGGAEGAAGAPPSDRNLKAASPARSGSARRSKSSAAVSPALQEDGSPAPQKDALEELLVGGATQQPLPLRSVASSAKGNRSRGSTATVNHDFDAIEADELSVRKGERVVVDGEESEGWVRVFVEGASTRRGMVPNSYLR